MGLDDKIDNKGDELKGKAKEAAGKATDDEQLEAEGREAVGECIGALGGMQVQGHAATL